MFPLTNLTISLGWRFKDMTAPQDIRRQKVGGFQLNGFLHLRKNMKSFAVFYVEDQPPSPEENLRILQNLPFQVYSPHHY